ncbi:MAG: hypothetical protein QF570_12665 [Myxococcota bacterium]|nr:hypothetical protein [Myxococcota bacterium]
MAAKKSSKRSSNRGKGRSDSAGFPAWLGVLLALGIAAVAGWALLTQQQARERNALPVLEDRPEAATQHDRDQIDQESRDQLRDILRQADREAD